MFSSFSNLFCVRPPPAAESMQIGSRTVPLLVVRNPRARRYLLRVQPDGAARLTIPRGGNRSEAQSFVERNHGWLEQQLQRLHAQPRGPVALYVGSEILLRGEIVRIEIDETGGIRLGREELKLRPAAIGAPFRRTTEDGPVSPSSPLRRGTEAEVANHAAADLRPVIERQLRALASVELTVRVAELAAQHQFSVQRVTVRNQKSRWGSCSRRGTLSLNWRLIQTPVHVRDYIILHELAHLRQMNHSRRFWQEVEQLCPEYRAAEIWLKANRQLLR